jgi:N-dimethylarginine dimethylaminohydrolase
MSESVFIQIEGHIFDSHLFEKILEMIREHGASYRIIELQLGASVEDISRARIAIDAPTSAVLESTLQDAKAHGAKVLAPSEIDPALREETEPESELRPLNWGRRYAMCAPEHFAVAYEINPWMHREIQVDRDKAWDQWNQLVATIEQAGGEVQRMEPAPGLPDYVFTANAGLIDDQTFIPSSFRHPERQAETPHAITWFKSQGYKVSPLPTGLIHEGAGDALPFNEILVSGYRMRSDAPSHAAIARSTRSQVRAIELVDQRFYHLDLTFCPLDSRRAIVVPEAWDAYGRQVMEGLIPEPLALEIDEAVGFMANSVVIDSTIVMPACSKRVESQLKKWGFEVVVVDVSEFMKAGGAVRCLTLALDVDLGPAPGK